MARQEEELLLSVADVTLIELTSGSNEGYEYATASLKSHNISQTVDTSEIRAGRKNAVIATLESNKTITVEIEDVHANRDWLAIAMDGKMETGQTVEVRVLPQKLTVQQEVTEAGEGGALYITLSKVPKLTSEIKVIHKGATLTLESNDIAIDGTKVTILDNAVHKDDVVEVMSYVHSATADVITVGGAGQGRAFAMYLEESVFNNDMKVIATKTTYFPRVVPESSFSMSGSSELAEQNMTYTFTVAQAEGKDFLGQIFYVAEPQA